MNNDIKIYADQVPALYRTGVTTEHSFRGPLQTLLESLLPKYRAVNEPQRSACGAPDYALVGKNDNLPYAYIEAKDLFDNDLRGINAKGHKEQFDRYKQALARVAFTDYLSFYFYVDGELKDSVTLLEQNAKGGFSITNEDKFVSLLNEWADCSLQPVNSATRLAQIMAHKAKLLADGLADDGKMVGKTFHRVQILDPATGTGTFLAETVRQIYKKFEGNEGMWPSYVEQSLRQRLHGFELLMAPYTITHLKLDMMLNGGQNSRHRLGVYLTNSLEECHPDTGTLWAQWLSEESTAANTIKRDTPVMVMMGNPPYSVSSNNKGEWISHLVV